MKTVKQRLLTTSALVGAATVLASGGAFAEEKKEMMATPPSLSLGGYYAMDAHFAEVDDSDANTQHMVHDAEVYFKMSGELENGIKIGGMIQLEGAGGNTGANYIDDHWVSLSSGWGRVDIGAVHSVGVRTSVGAPNGGYGVTSGVQTEWFRSETASLGCAFRCALGGTNLDAGTADQGVHYFSPSFNGFSFAVGYRPEASSANSKNTGPIAPDTMYQDAVDAAVRYDGQVGDVGVSASLNVGAADGGSGGPDYEHVVGGVSLSAMGFTVGGRMGNEGTDGPHNGTSYGVGVAYTTGPLKVGIDAFAGSIRDGEEPGDSEYDAWAVSGTYTVGPGLALKAGFQSGTLDMDDAASIDGNAFTMGIAVGF